MISGSLSMIKILAKTRIKTVKKLSKIEYSPFRCGNVV